MTRNAGVLGRLTKAATADLPDLLDELTDGKGDGCIAVERTRLEGVADHVSSTPITSSSSAAPCSIPDPGPVACMPVVLSGSRQTENKEIVAMRTACSEASGSLRPCHYSA